MPASTPGSSAENNWYAIHTWHQHEKGVAAILSQKGFHIFLPLYTAAHRWKDRLKQVSLPLFPGYLFFKGGLERRIQILCTPGVCSIVGYAYRAAAISESEVEGVRRMVESPLRVEPHPFLSCGDRVRITAGPLAGLEGILTRPKNLYRMVLTVNLLERACAVEIDASMVEPVRN